MRQTVAISKTRWSSAFLRAHPEPIARRGKHRQIAGWKCTVDLLAAALGIGDDDLLAVVAIEFGSRIGKRHMAKHEHAALPGEPVCQILFRLALYGDSTR